MITNQQLVSIIIPVYNSEEYIAKTLESCISQTYKNIEIIVVNDGSTDTSCDVINAYLKKDARVFALQQQNKGVVVARNIGISCSKGEWIVFLDSDDTLPSDAIELLVKETCNDIVQIVIGNYEVVDDNGVVLRRSILRSGTYSDKSLAIEKLLFEDISFSLWAKLFHYSLFKNIHTKTDLKLGEDAYITIQLFSNAKIIHVINKSVYNYLYRNNSVSNKPSNHAVQSILIFIQYTLDFFDNNKFLQINENSSSLRYFVMKEYFTYLRFTGDYSSNPIRDFVNSKSLSDSRACSLTPYWRLLMLKSFRANVYLGSFVRQLLLFIRKYIN